MRVMVVYESVWGNTEKIAQEIAAGFDDVEVEVREVSEESEIGDNLDLLVLGGPTHAFSMSSSSTRDSARNQGATNIPKIGIREWIERQKTPTRPILVATFDTKVVTPRLPGSAAKKAMKPLIALGFQPLAKPKTFRVHGYSGPVAEGELERAREWGVELAQDLRHL